MTPRERIAVLMADNRERTSGDIATALDISLSGARAHVEAVREMGLVRVTGNLGGATIYRRAK